MEGIQILLTVILYKSYLHPQNRETKISSKVWWKCYPLITRLMEEKTRIRKKIKLTEQEMDEILKYLPTYWKRVGEKKMVENAYRYLMMHSELQNTELGIKAYNYAGKRITQIWCRETNTEDEEWMCGFITMMFADQNRRSPGMAERGKRDAEFLTRLFGSHQNCAEKIMSTDKSKKQ